MTEYIFTELGYFSERDCKAIKKAMDGQTFMNFEVAWSNWAGNCTLIIKTDYADTESNIKAMFVSSLMCQFAELIRTRSMKSFKI